MPYAGFDQPQVFFNPLQQLLSSFDALFTSPLDEDGEPYEAESQGFDWLQGRFADPNRFLRVMLDMLHVFFDREMVGSFFLNGNPSFLFEQVPEGAWQLGYASALSEPNACLKTLFEDELVTQLSNRNQQYDSATGMFLAVISHRETRLMQLLDEVATFATVGLSVGEAFDRIGSIVTAKGGDEQTSTSGCHSDNEAAGQSDYEPGSHHCTPPPSFFSTGFAFDDALGDRVRLSLLSIHPAKPNHKHKPHDAYSGLNERFKGCL